MFCGAMNHSSLAQRAGDVCCQLKHETFNSPTSLVNQGGREGETGRDLRKKLKKTKNGAGNREGNIREFGPRMVISIST